VTQFRGTGTRQIGNLSIYRNEYVPGKPDIGGTFKVQRIPGPVRREIQTNFIYVETPDPSEDLTPPL